MFVKVKHRLNGDYYCYVNTEHIDEIYPPTDDMCGTVFMVNKNYSLDIERDEYEKIMNEHTLEDFRDVNKTINDLVNHIKELEDKIIDLEETVGLLYSEYESEHEPYRNG